MDTPIFEFEYPNAYPVKVWKLRKGYAVVYGLQRKEFPTAAAAFQEAGYCLRHAAECEGLLD